MRIDINKEVIGIPLKTCFQCGKKVTNRHHAIPVELKPKRNITIPLCDDHKNITHHIIKQFYIPNDIRKKIKELNKLLNEALGKSKSIRESFKLHKLKNHNTAIQKFGESGQ